MAQYTLKIDNASYLDQVSKLQNYLNQLNSTINKYQSLEARLDTFMGGEDANYERTKTLIQNNIKTVIAAYDMTQAAIEGLQQNLQNADTIIQQTSADINTAIDDVGSAVNAAFEAISNLI